MEGDQAREIAGFRIESEIGRGGMGVVYLAHQEFPERRVALKLLAPDLASDPVFRERFIRESNAAASTEHPHIVPIYGAGESGGHLYLAMRYIEGTDLGTLLAREESLSPDRASRICAEIADALQAAHERGLIHRDVKPGNILLDARDHAYLTDFGLIRRTKLHTDLTRTGQFMGTIDYVAPEQIKGGEIDGRVDVYSLGCVLYECLTGAPPFRRGSEVATMYAHLEDPPPRPSSKRPGMSPRLAATVQKAMAKRPGDRFATPGEMADALKGREVRPRRAGRRWVASAVAAFLAIAIVASIVVLSDDEPSDAPPDASTGGATIPVNSLVQIEAEDSAILSVTPTSAGSGGDLPAVAVGEGAVWMLVSGTLGRVDAADPAGIDAVTIGTINTTTSFALAERLVWAATDTGIARVSATDLRQLGVIELAEGSIVSAYVTARGGQVWAVVGNVQLTQIDPRTAEVIESIDVGQSASGITAGFDRVWVADDLTGTITPVGMETLQPGTPIAMPGDIDDLEAGAGAVWSLDTDAGVVTPIDPDTGALGSPVRVGVQPTDLASGLGALWVTNNGDGTISKVDQVTGGSTTLDVGAPVAGIAVDERGQELWVVVAVTH